MILTAVETTTSLFKFSSSLPPETPALLRRLTTLAALGAAPAATPADVDTALAACAALAAAPTTAPEAYGPLRRRALPTLTVLTLAPDMRVRAAAAAALSALLRAPPVRVAIWAPVSAAALMHHRAPDAEIQRELLAALATVVHCVTAQTCQASTESTHWANATAREIAESEAEALAEAQIDVEARRSLQAMPSRCVPGQSRRSLSCSRNPSLLLPGDAPSVPVAAVSQAKGKYFSRDIRAALAAMARLLDAAPDANHPAAALERLLAVEDCARRARAALVDEKEYRCVIVSGFVESAPALAAVVVRALWREGTGGVLEQRQQCTLNTAHSCLTLLRALFVAAPEAICHPRAPLLVALSDRAEELARSAVSAANAMEGEAAGREDLVDFLDGIVSTMRAMTAACGSGAADVQVEIVTERCLRNLCSVLTSILRPALRESAAEATDWAALQTLVAWSQLARVTLSGALWEHGPSYSSAVPVFAQMVRYIGHIELLRAPDPEITNVKENPSVHTGGNCRSRVCATSSPQCLPPTQFRTAQQSSSMIPTSKTIAPVSSVCEVAGGPPEAKSLQRMASVDEGDVDVEIEDVASDSCEEVDEMEDSTSSAENPGFNRKSFMSTQRRRQRDFPNLEYHAEGETIPSPFNFGLEIRDNDLLGRALHEAMQLLVSQSSSAAVVRDLFRALMRLYSSDVQTWKESPMPASGVVGDCQKFVPSSPSRLRLDVYDAELVQIGSIFRDLSSKDFVENVGTNLRASLQTLLRCVDGEGTRLQVEALLAETRSLFLANLLHDGGSEGSEQGNTMQAALQAPETEAELLKVKEEVVLLKGQVDEMRMMLKNEKQMLKNEKQMKPLTRPIRHKSLSFRQRQ